LVSPWSVFGLLHRLALAPSSEHKNVLWLSDDENETLVVSEVIVPLGPPSASVCGGAVATLALGTAGDTGRAEARLG
jgi:hypothetical protein